MVYFLCNRLFYTVGTFTKVKHLPPLPFSHKTLMLGDKFLLGPKAFDGIEMRVQPRPDHVGRLETQ